MPSLLPQDLYPITPTLWESCNLNSISVLHGLGDCDVSHDNMKHTHTHPTFLFAIQTWFNTGMETPKILKPPPLLELEITAASPLNRALSPFGGK